MAGSTSAQSSSAAPCTSATSATVSVSAASSSNRPPLNQATGMKPTMPPRRAMAAKSCRALASNGCTIRREASSICVSSPGGSRPTSSANRQNTKRLTKCATACGSCPRSRNCPASMAKRPAASAVTAARVLPGSSCTGSENTCLSTCSRRGTASSARPISMRSETVLVQLVRMTTRSMSHVTSSGGFSSAPAYCRSCRCAACRSLCLPLYSQANRSRRHTSAQPSPPLALAAPFSKA